MTHHLEVLRGVSAGGLGVVEGAREADPLDRRLRDAPDRGGRLDPEQVEDGRDHVDDVGVLGSDLPFGLDALRPRDDERVAGATTVGLSLPATEWRVPGPRPAPGVVVEVVGSAELVDDLQAVLEGLRGVVEELRLVGGAGVPTLGAGAVVGDHHDDGVVELPLLAQEVSSRPRWWCRESSASAGTIPSSFCCGARASTGRSSSSPTRATTSPRSWFTAPSWSASGI